MRLCNAHWTELDTALRDRGLGAYIAPDHDAFGQRAMAQARERSVTRANWEPILAAHKVIVSAAISLGGIALLRAATADSENIEGHQTCPFCFLIAGCDCTTRGNVTCGYSTLCVRVADVVLTDAKRLGLVGVS